MRILLVTFSDVLPFAITQALNPANDYCAIVVDEVEPARNFLSQFNYPAENVFPLYELKECVENFYFDCVLCIGDGRGKLDDEVKRCGVPRNKFVHLTALNTAENFLLERALRYYKKNFAQFKMFATGISYTELGLIPKLFTKKLFNFGRASQDIYFDFKIAKKNIQKGGGLTHALVGLAPYFLHYDSSKTFGENSWLTAYAIALKDLRNFWLPVEKYRSLFREEYLNLKLPIDDVEIDCVTPFDEYSDRKMSWLQRIDSKKELMFGRIEIFPTPARRI